MSGTRSRWAYLAAITPIVFGTTYLLTTEFLPPDRPMLAATMRALPTGIVLVLGTRPPPREWWGRIALLSVLYCSAFFPLLFVAAYRLPGGVASVINSLSPIIVVGLSVPWLHTKIKPIQLLAGALGVFGVGLLVLRSSARLDIWGLLAMTTCVIMISFAAVLTKRWGFPPDMNAARFTGWTFLLGGLALLPFMLIFEGLPDALTRPQRRRVDLPGRGQRRPGVLVVVLGSATAAGQFGHLPRAAEPRGRRRLGLGRAVAGAERCPDRRRRDRARLGRTRPGLAAPPVRRSSIEAMTDPERSRPSPLAPSGVRGRQRTRPPLHPRQRTHVPGLDPYLAGLSGRRGGRHGPGPFHAGMELPVRLTAVALIGSGLVCAAGGFRRWMRQERAIRLGEPLPSTSAIPFVAAVLVLVALTGLILVGVI